MAATPPSLVERVPGWNPGDELAATRSRSGVLLFHDPLRPLLRTDAMPVWPPPEVAQKLSKADLSASYPPEVRAPLEAALGRYCALQSVNSEDAMTWAAFGPVVYADQPTRERFVADLLVRCGLSGASPVGATVWLWRRLPHPDTWVSGGPEIDVGVQTVDTLLLLEAKWRSPESTNQGLTKDRSQTALRIALCRDEGLRRLYPGVRHFGVVAVTLDGGLLAAGSPSPGGPSDTGLFPEVTRTDLTWADICALDSHPAQEELIRYFVWKRELSEPVAVTRRRQQDTRLRPHPVRGDGGLLVRAMQAVDGFRAKYGTWPTVLEIDPEWWEVLRDAHLGPAAEANVRKRLEIRTTPEVLRAGDPAGRSYDYLREAWRWRHPGEPARHWCGIAPTSE